MVDFDFLKVLGWQEMYADGARAERFAFSDPRSACFYSRRTAEQLIDFLRDVLAPRLPYKTDLAAKIHDAAFQSKIGVGIVQTLNVIRKLGTVAVHDSTPIPQRRTLDACGELYHVMLRAAYRHSTDPSL